MSKRLLFAGISTMQDHAGQHKLYFIADIFARRGIPVSVVVPDRTENRQFLESRPHISAHYYPPGGVLGDMRHRAKALTLGDWSAVWVVGVGLRSFTARGWWASQIPVIKDFDEFPSMIESFGGTRRAYLRWIERRMIAQAQGFTCASAYLENAIRRVRRDIGDRLLRLPVAISEEEHVVDPGLVTELKSKLTGRPLLLYVGSVNRFYEEQLDEITSLARTLRSRSSNVCVRILGGGPDLEYFKQKAQALHLGDTIDFAGHVSRAQLASHMEAADVLLFPFPATPFNLSRCPTKAYHYAAANRPIVTNQTGEVAALFGSSARFYPERDINSFANCCEQALSDRSRYDNKISFASLTWEARASTFAQWLGERGWLPQAARTRAASILVP